jgi:phosphoribosylformylglycinamidine synthase PurS subunit
VSEYRLEVRIMPRAGLLDPQGKAVQNALRSLEFEGIADVGVGRLVLLRLDAASRDSALETVRDMCRRLLANPVTEDFDIRVAEPS